MRCSHFGALFKFFAKHNTLKVAIFYNLNNLTEKVCQKNMKKANSLPELKRGECGIVKVLLCEGGIRRRLLDIGLIPGTSVLCCGKSPLGDPSAYLVRGKLIAIRKEDAKKILLI